MSTLYHVAAQYRAQLDALAELDLDAQTVADTVEGLQGELQDKLQSVIAYGLSLSVDAAGQAEAAKRMAERAKATEKRSQALFDYARDAMQATGLGTVETDEFAAKLAKKPASVSVTDPEALPPAFWRTPEPPAPQPDKAAIAAALKSGAIVPGAALIQGYRLAVR
jgi:hypothetical protein